MTKSEFSAGSDQLCVTYVSEDTSGEVDPAALFGEIAADATARAQAGLHIVSMAAVPLRHAGVYLGRTGSGYESKVAVAVIYAP